MPRHDVEPFGHINSGRRIPYALAVAKSLWVCILRMLIMVFTAAAGLSVQGSTRVIFQLPNSLFMKKRPVITF